MDVVIINFIQDHFHNSVSDAVFPFVTNLGEYGFVWLLLGAVLLMFQKTRRCGLAMLVSMAVTFILGEILLKQVVARPRPFMDFPSVPLLIAQPSGYSFPSGHAASSFTAALSIFYYYRKAGTAALILASLIAFSRVFLFVHYPTDLLGGAALGLLIAFAVHKGDKRLKVHAG